MHAIETVELTKRYPDAIAVTDLDLAIPPGEVFGFVGPNGAGKSTTIALLLGLRSPTSGRIRISNHSPSTHAVDLRRTVGALPEHGGLLDRLTGREHLTFLGQMHGSGVHPNALFDRVGLDPTDGDRAVGTYSTGMAQRLRLAMALVGDPDVLILDEPAAGLDPEGNARLREIVRNERRAGTTVFFSSHQLDDVAAVCDRVGFLVGGRLREIADGEASREALAERFAAVVRRAR